MKNKLQYIRTDQAIVHALMSLVKEKPFEKITVQDILERAPVTRATFYAHFHDKYEIVEKLQTRFFEVRASVQKELQNASPAQAQAIIRKSVSDNKDLVHTLLSVKTEQVDLRESLVSDLVNYYLENNDNSYKHTEARIYAQAKTEAYLAFIYDEKMDFSINYVNSMYLSVALKLLKLSDDQETIQFLKKKLDL